MRPARLPRQRGRIRLRTIVFIRWIAVVGQLSTLLFVHFAMGYALPLVWTLGTVAALAAVTAGAQLRRSASARLTDRESALYFAFDMLQLSVLLFLTGGLDNPFAILILAPVTVSATTLSYRSTVGLAALAITFINALAVFHLPLPWSEEGLDLAPNFVTALAIALGLAVIFITSYVYRVAQESRRLSDALAAAQAALDREQSLSSLGALAAAAAHELGSPLGTISLVSRELQRDLAPDNPLRSDVDLLVSQSQRCREILTELSRRPEDSSADHFAKLPLPLLIELAAEPHRRPEVALRIEEAPDPADPVPPMVPRRPELIHGLGNLLQNAIEFAREEVKIALTWNAAKIGVTISDDGVGFPPDLLDRLGDPYLSRGPEAKKGSVKKSGAAKTGERPGDHMGLGIFIAQQLIEKSGGSVSFSNNAFGGAEVHATWPRSAFEGALDHD
ncbi:MAG TPA: ActS/PrrB/RegB family redox-sensitive histidine kinase [Candidatus Binatia bacterium]|nr:ActS/PrrB/RegB family redox-sensitive histidine kinase [Candidatus Binatia bacterium]